MKTYETALQSVRGLLKTASQFVDALGIYPRGAGICLDAVMLALLSKCIRVGDAVCLLVDNDFHDEAFGLSRTILEMALTARYISNNDSFKRSETFVKFYAKDHEQWTKLIAKYYPGAVPEFHPNHDKMLQTAKQFNDPHKWSGKPVRDLAMEEDGFEQFPNGQPFRWEFDYEVIYKWTSHFVHGTVVAVEEHAMEPRVQFRVMGGRQSSNKGEMALFNAALYLHRTLLAVFRSLNHEIRKEVLDEFDSVLKRLAVQHDATPRDSN